MYNCFKQNKIKYPGGNSTKKREHSSQSVESLLSQTGVILSEINFYRNSKKLTKEAKHLYLENYKTLKKEMKKIQTNRSICCAHG